MLWQFSGYQDVLFNDAASLTDERTSMERRWNGADRRNSTAGRQPIPVALC